jgi:hypothetical protein
MRESKCGRKKKGKKVRCTDPSRVDNKTIRQAIDVCE